MRVVFSLLLVGLVFSQEPTIADLVKQLGDDDFDVREKAAQLLEGQGEKARAALAAAAKDHPDAEIRKRAADLVQTLDRMAEARAVADKLQALGQLATPPFDPKWVKPLVEKQGPITEDEAWTADKTYHIKANTTVAAGTAVTIQAGTLVLVEDGADFHVQAGGRLLADGTANRPVVFAAMAEKAGRDGHWGRFIPAGDVTLDHVQVRRGRGVVLRSDRATVEHLAVYDTDGDALTLAGSVRATGTVTVREATGAGLVAEGCHPTVGTAIVSRCKVGVVVKNGAYPTFRDLSVADAKEDGVRVKDGSYPTFEKGVVARAGTGMRVMEGAYPRVTSLLLADLTGDGVIVEGGSYPSLVKVEVAGAEGVGLRVTGGSYPYVGVVQARGCKKGEQVVEPNSRVQPLQLERLRTRE